jgi:DNA-binding NarL/FixJ family response regulator
MTSLSAEHTKKTRTLLVDDNVLFRAGLASLISTQPDFSVVGELSGGKEAVQASMNLTPDLILLDILQFGTSGLDTVEQIKRRQPQVGVILLTNFRNEDYVRAALQVGTDGYVLKDTSLEELLTSMRTVAMGKKYLSPDVMGRVVEGFLNPDQSQAKSSKLELLTQRERGILQLIAEGRTNRSTAEFLNLSPKTVEKHRASLMHKLGLRNATELTLVAMDMGLIARPKSLSRLVGDRRARGTVGDRRVQTQSFMM